MHAGFRYRLYPNAEQRTLFAKHFGCVRFAYNHALALKIKTWETEKKSLSQFDLCKVFPKLKKEEETAWLSEVCSHALQCEMANLDVAFTKFFREKKGFPKFKSKRDSQSYSTNTGISVGEKTVRLPKLGDVSAVVSRPASGRIVKATVSQTATGKYFVSVLCEDGTKIPEKMPVTEAGTVGVDLGLTDFAVLSTGERVANPRYHKKALARLRRAQRKLSRRSKGSNNRIKQRRKVARIHERVADRRRDFHHKLSTRLVRDNQTNAIALETLSVSGMQKNSRLARSIGDAGWTSFVGMLEYKAERAGKTVLRIGRFEPSSKLCSCGVVNKVLKLSDRIWTCGTCGTTHDRDILAASNIKRMALHPRQSNGKGQINTAGNAGIHACGERQ
jgi:putative transposase